MKWYYYLHTNGSLIGKNPVIVDNDAGYFNSPFVKHVWKIETDEKATLYEMMFEALGMGANVPRVKELAEKNKCDYDDSLIAISCIKPNDTMRKGISIFIKEVLSMEVDEYWDKVKALADDETNYAEVKK